MIENKTHDIRRLDFGRGASPVADDRFDAASRVGRLKNPPATYCGRVFGHNYACIQSGIKTGNRTMKILLTIGTAATMLALPLGAQRMGHSNTNAPTVQQSLVLGDMGSVTVSYTSITWGGGRWAQALASPASRDGMRATVNEAAVTDPLGTLETSVNLTIGPKQLAAGNYKLAFMINEEFSWELVLSNDSQRTVVPLEFGSNALKSERLQILLMSGDEDFTGRLFIGFSDKAADLGVKVLTGDINTGAEISTIADTGTATTTFINTECPLMEEPVVANKSVTYKGYTIGLCCEDCVLDWNDLNGADRDEYLADLLKTASAAAFTCPMHPEVKSATAGRCPDCGMNLVRRESLKK